MRPRFTRSFLRFFRPPPSDRRSVSFGRSRLLRYVSPTAHLAKANAALWIHLYAVTVAAVVIVPRLTLALVARMARSGGVARRFTFDMNEPYFRRLAGSFTAGAARLRVIPYSYTVDEAAMSGLRAVAVALLGDDAEVTAASDHHIRSRNQREPDVAGR